MIIKATVNNIKIQIRPTHLTAINLQHSDEEINRLHIRIATIWNSLLSGTDPKRIQTYCASDPLIPLGSSTYSHALPLLLADISSNGSAIRRVCSILCHSSMAGVYVRPTTT
ncbi:hypothetical protein E2C01_091567 [Portunus trituberculatus]|uniref:Uncharacterized protein n=1 Tax=Portunus trituberculatus TaxID=210409 RepID=A0A5B7JPR0_PORTR|nr:hypothetical protein [Portunus trituberculatus]